MYKMGEDEQEQTNNDLQSETTIQKFKNVGKGAIDFAKENPETVATGVGAAAVLGSTAGMLFLAGILGGKSKKRLRNKRQNRKTIRPIYKGKNRKQNKTRRTGKSIRKNKQRKTKKL